MKHRLILFMASLVVAAFPAWCSAADARDGLVTVETHQFDQLGLRPNVDLASYRTVMIDPVRVEFQKGWKRRMNESPDVGHRIDDAEVKRIADDMAADHPVGRVTVYDSGRGIRPSNVHGVPQVQVAGHEPLQPFFRVIQLVQPRRGGRDDGKPEIHADEESIGGCHPGREEGVGAFGWLVGVRHGAGV